VNRSLTAERRNKISQILVANGSIRIGEIARMFGVSTETIRKDLIYLDDKGIAKKSHGGAMSTSEFIEQPITARSLENMELKSRIAQSALELIPNNGVVILDSGSTILCLAKLLAIKKHLSIITNSIAAANVLAGSENDTYLTGGEIRGVTMALAGFLTVSSLNMIHADVAFLGTSGFASHNGPCAESFIEADVKRVMLKNCNKSIVLGDSTKFKSTALVEYASWKDIGFFITDDNASKDDLAKVGSMTEVILAR
jgi:DeoR/GlpR family transcriptional regulator of sugar metabolism